jgi:flavin-dependent dehydrogenase
MNTHYQVIIIGGRPAGSTLAARLGKLGIRTLLIERAHLPSLPPASSPIIYAPSLQLLDEIGADENAYAHNTPRIRRTMLHNSQFKLAITIPEAYGRDYGYAIDRARFDGALFDHAASFPSVEVRREYSAVEITQDESGRVTGIIGLPRGGEREALTADLVVGADGRNSLVARAVDAKVYDAHTDHPTALYYAYWENVRPYDEAGATAVAYEGGPGYGLLVMESADNTAAVTMEGQEAVLQPQAGKMTEFYLEKLRANPALMSRLENARMVTKIHGMAGIGNLYRQPGGAGWALVGDAYHQHDPLDGQGIYNALFSAKALAWAIRYWQDGDKGWPEALEWYDDTVRSRTYGMYQRTLETVRQSFFTAPVQIPAWAGTLFRWVMEDPATTALFGKMLTRQLPPEVVQMATPAVALRALMRGPWVDARRQLQAWGVPGLG